MADGILQLTIMKLLSQFEQVDSATPFARKLEGNTSLGIAHGCSLSESVTIDLSAYENGSVDRGVHLSELNSLVAQGLPL